MCGLVGLVSKYQNGFTQVQKNVFSTLLFVDTLRGDDSTGAFVIKNNGDLKMAKDAGNASKFIATKEYDDLLSIAFNQGAAMIGHNRKATRGVVNDTNAHPFMVDDRIVLVHNGTLWGDHKQHADVEVDSHAIAHLLAKHDTEAAINKINGAFALIWYDFEDQTLNFLRNKERPLYWAETKSEYLWASEASMLNFVAERFDLKFESAPSMLPEFTHSIFSLKDKQWDIQQKEIKYTPPKYEYSTPTRSSSANYGYLDEDWQFYRPTHRSSGGSAWAFGNRNSSQNSKDSANDDSKQSSSILYDICKERKDKLKYGSSICACTEDEHLLGQKLGGLMSTDEFAYVHAQYPSNSSVVAQAVDVSYINGINDTDGIFLWLTPVDDPALVLRYRYPANHLTEEQAINLCAAGAHYNCMVSNRSWLKVAGKTYDGKTQGWVLFNVTSMSLINNTIDVHAHVVH